MSEHTYQVQVSAGRATGELANPLNGLPMLDWDDFGTQAPTVRVPRPVD